MSGNILRDYLVALTSPTSWIGILLILGLILLFKNKTKVSRWFLTTGIVLFLFFSFDPGIEFLLDKFENQYPALRTDTLTEKEKISYVVVLAGGYSPNSPLHPLTTELTSSTLFRLVEGIRIYRELPGTRLILTGKGWEKKSEAQAMKEMAILLGVNSDDIIVESESRNTYEHTQNLKAFIQNEPFILVTSALHMPRSMGVFLKEGYKPIPAPTAHILTGHYEIFNMKVPFARGSNLDASDRLFNELSAIARDLFLGRR